MESYVWGIGRGTVKKKAIQVSVVSQSEGTAGDHRVRCSDKMINKMRLKYHSSPSKFTSVMSILFVSYTLGHPLSRGVLFCFSFQSSGYLSGCAIAAVSAQRPVLYKASRLSGRPRVYIRCGACFSLPKFAFPAPPPSTTETLASSTDSPPPSSSHKSELEVTSVTTPSQDVETRILGATTEGTKTLGSFHTGDLGMLIIEKF